MSRPEPSTEPAWLVYLAGALLAVLLIAVIVVAA